VPKKIKNNYTIYIKKWDWKNFTSETSEKTIKQLTKRFLITHFEIRVIFFKEKTSYFLICLGDSIQGGEQGPKGAQDSALGVGVEPKAIPLSNVKSPFLDPANPLN